MVWILLYKVSLHTGTYKFGTTFYFLRMKNLKHLFLMNNL